ncbi:hypothetical protein EGW08_013945 [Elysia chlorotica]|uniref:Uncharacterized protein n=1 Tax=Elysia chlorotica TaxID=188477 RepID=A0A433T9L8_ELYCH|nr:hypothetical protein EGW08_013945 [Elysia chlorotica]
MDSRLIAGAYSQHYRALEEQNSLVTADKIDSIARAKKLSHETNKRRRTQAQKRKIEALREEKRRHEILSKRREEQKQATEKYQRSHIPPSARQHSSRRSPRRPGGGQILEDALRLIRGSPGHSRPGSARERVMSPRKENENPFEKSYFENHGHVMSRPGSGRIGLHINQHARAELMDHSLQNFTSSKTLFEQQLEQQQSLLLKQQQQSLRDFDNAVQREIDSDISNYDDGFKEEVEKKFSKSDDSCSSVDSLEESNESGCNRSGNWSHEMQRDGNALRKINMFNNMSSVGKPIESGEGDLQQYIPVEPSTSQQPIAQFYLHSNDHGPSGNNVPLNLDITPSAAYQGTSNIISSPKSTSGVLHDKGQLSQETYWKESKLDQQMNTMKNNHAHTDETKSKNHPIAAPLKQLSTDSLESVSSVSTVSLVKAPAQNFSSQAHAVSNIEINSSSTQVAWVSPSSKSESVLSMPAPKNVSNNNDTGLESYNPRYASAISLSIWPGPSGNNPTSNATQFGSSTSSTAQSAVNNVQIYGSRSSASSVTPYPGSGLVPRNVSNAGTYSPVKNDSVLKSGVVGSGLTSGAQTALSGVTSSTHAVLQSKRDEVSGIDMNLQNLQYPFMHDNNTNVSGVQTYSLVHQQQPLINTSSAVSPYNQSSQLLSSALPNTKSTGINGAVPVSFNSFTPNSSATQPQSTLQPHPVQMQQQFQQTPNPQQQQYPNLLSYQQHQFSKDKQQQRQQPQLLEYPQQQEISYLTVQPNLRVATAATTQGTPVPAVRTIFPHQRPPVPKSETAVNQEIALIEQEACQQKISESSHNSKPSAVVDSEQEDLEGNSQIHIKGILKVSSGLSSQQASAKAAGHPRDSLEVLRLQGDKKLKKKSVRFAEGTAKEDILEEKELFKTAGLMISNSGAQINKPPVSRPASARVVSTTQKTDTTVARVARAGSAGTIRQMANLPAQSPQARNVQLPSGHEQTNDPQGEISHPDTHNLKTIPPSPQHSIINRPKAAAHIIMSNSEHHGMAEKSKMLNAISATQTASIAHKSVLESKVKNINNPVSMGGKIKIPTSAPAVPVYHVGRAGEEDLGNVYHQQACADDNGSNIGAHGSDGTLPHEQRQRLRDPSPASKRVPISNSVVTRTSIVPASTKISIPATNTGAPSYSTSMANGAGAGSGGAVYNENGMRIDRTPTDEEITWLWDKVRNCLHKEDPASGGIAGNGKFQNGSGGNTVGSGTEPCRQPPMMSTKLIDGASLGFSASAGNGTNGLRVGTGFFQPPAAQNNKVRPALQQQGSYLRRYGLLKQRRVASASGLSSTSAQPPVAVQRASSAVHSGQSQQAGVNYPANQQGEQDGPQPIAQSYMPHDGVSESTAAFIMAERLAKQSLSDSHIQTAMLDAQTKQEIHNTKSTRLAVNRGGHSALSIEEQNLLASLDKLNERLRVADTHYSGTIQYHQPYQAHLSGFRGNQGLMTGNKRNPILQSPRSLNQAQQRAQSARIRQQTRQYR